MKKVLTIVLAMFCLASCEKSTQKNDLAELKLNGKVKSIREIPYEAVEIFGEVGMGDVLGIINKNLQITFNDKGNKLEENWFNPDGSLYRKWTYKYDDKGNKIEQNSFNPDGSLSFKYTYKYDDKGNQIELNSFNPDDNLDFKLTYKYDDKGNEIERNSFNSDGSLFLKYTYKYTYDQQGNWIQRIEYKVKNGVEKPSQIAERTIEYY